MSVRLFVEEDRDALKHVYLETRRQLFSWLSPGSLQDSDFDRDTKEEKIWVYENEGKVIGFISVWEPDNFIHHLFVLPEFSRNGYGSKLLDACLADIGYSVTLKCVSQNFSALNFYKSKGWTTISKGVSSDGEYHLMQAIEP
jgi:ribosomal protein S18 acetylase RimI-like enzyme